MAIQTPTQEQVRNAWDALAPGFDEHVTPQSTRLGADALRRAGLGSGMRFLDVAAGSGALSIPAGHLGAHVLATDIAPVMVERLRARARSEGLPDIDARVMDGQALDLEDDTFDVSGSQHGVSLFPDPPGGLAEMVRVTRPGGRVLIVAFGAMQKTDFFALFMGAMRAVVPGFNPPPADPPLPPFRLADPDEFRRKLTAAGLTDVRVETTSWEMRFESVTHYWSTVTSSNPIATQLTAQATEEQLSEVRRVLDGMFRERSGGEPGAVLHNAANIGTGTK